MEHDATSCQLIPGKRDTGRARPDRTAGRRPHRHAIVLLSTLVALSLIAGLLPSLADANHDTFCYAVANPSKNQTLLVTINKLDFDPATNETVVGAGDTGTEKTDSIAFQFTTGVLFGSDINMSGYSGRIGTYNLTTGDFTARPNAVGSGNGISSTQQLYDMSGLAFDPDTGFLYATHVRTTSGHADLLFRVDPETGSLVQNAFGQGHDYVVMPILPDYPLLQWVDDIAIDPADGQMYGVINNSTVGDRLIKINKATGATTDVGAFGIGEVEGMDFDPHGKLWVTAGVTDDSVEWYLYEVNKATGQAFDPRRIDNSYNYEALACMTDSYIGNSTPTPTPTVTGSPTSTQSPTQTPPPDVPTSTPETPVQPQPHQLYLPLLQGP